MKREIFRKKSLERISSPERIDSYIKTTSAPSKLIIAAIVLVLAGFTVWGFYGRVELTCSAVTVCRDGIAVCYIGEDDAESISGAAEFRIGEKSYRAEKRTEVPTRVENTLSEYEAHVGSFNGNDWIYAVTLDKSMSDGIYKTEVSVKKVSPISLLLN